jgi:hypothetical protein
MVQNNEKQVYIHVGTGKTGTTFLQYRVFPKLKGICYIQRTRYKKSERIIKNTTHHKYLVSREFDQQLEREVAWFSSIFPNAIPIIVFRRHDSYIASQYRRFVKNGFHGHFTDFFDVEHDNGFFKKQDLNYSRHITILENYFSRKPAVLFYDELQNSPDIFIEKLSRLLDVSVDKNSLNLRRKHTSYTEKQLKAILAAGKYINLRKRRIFASSVLHLLWRLYLNGLRYSVLFLGKIAPTRYFGSEPLIPLHELEKVRQYYANDWEQIKTRKYQ